MTLATLVFPTRVSPADYSIESAASDPKVVVFEDAQRWNIYANALRGAVKDILYTQFLGEAERVIREKGPFDAHIIGLDRVSGTEHGLRNGVDLAERIVRVHDDPELMWFLSKDASLLEAAQERGFTRLYGLSEQLVNFPPFNQFAEDIRQELMYGRRAL